MVDANSQINEIATMNLKQEVALIADKEIAQFVLDSIKVVPGTFWMKPSAFYSGHHPNDELCDWGNLRHIKRAFSVAVLLANSAVSVTSEKDTLFAAVLLHDVGKYGIAGDSIKIRHDHADLAASILQQGNLPYLKYRYILDLIECHMGRWGRREPQNDLEWICHFSDCIASCASFNIPVALVGV